MAGFPLLPHFSHHKGRFFNPWETPSRSFSDFLKWRLGRGEKEDPPFPYSPSDLRLPKKVEPRWDLLREVSPTLKVTWIGHSTFLIQWNQYQIVTDPVFSEKIGPFSGFVGIRRKTPPGLSIEELPQGKRWILVSHNHYDHLDIPSLSVLAKGSVALFPLKAGEIVNDLPFAHFEEMDWGERTVFEDLTVLAVPAQHFSMRTLWDRDETLWCGYLIYIGPYTIYFAGDTGFGPFFPWIKDQAGKIDLALLPIGAYRPRWFMRPVHLDPEEAVQVHLLLKPSLSIGMHWGAFRQAEEPLGEPPLYLSYALKKLGVSEEEFRVLDLGETVVIGGRSY